MGTVIEARGKSKASKRPFMRLFTSDYRDGTARLSFEQKGFYMQVLTLLHDGERVPADPRKLGVMMQCDPRTAARLTQSLIAAGKLYEQDGELRNKRIDRDLEPTSAEDRSDFAETSAELPGDVGEKSGRTFQKAESNQDPPKHTNGITTSISNSRTISREDSHQASVEQDAEGLAGLNGMAVSMIGDVQRWMVGGDERSARTWLANTSRTFGAEITKRAYQKLGTDMAEGNPIARPLQTWTAIAQRMKADSGNSQGSPVSAYQRARAEILASGGVQ
jgi:uncharacterized protein YdaU (DUF1376 family)